MHLADVNFSGVDPSQFGQLVLELDSTIGAVGASLICDHEDDFCSLHGDH
jgi:hypothetical protein